MHRSLHVSRLRAPVCGCFSVWPLHGKPSLHARARAGPQRLQEPASLDFTYVDDYSRHLLHYVASGISGRHRSLAQLYNNEDVTCRSAHAAQRAALMRHLLTSGQLKGIDLNVTDAGCGASALACT